MQSTATPIRAARTSPAGIPQGSQRSSARRSFLALNALGGIAVLGSYVWGAQHPALFSALWGGVPELARPLYTVNMFLAAGGFLFVLATILRAEPSVLRFELATLRKLYALILIPSALWLPLTFAQLESPSAWLWLLVRLDLAAVGIGALGVFVWLLLTKPARTQTLNRIAAITWLPFILQTAVLDALIWPAYFTVVG